MGLTRKLCEMIQATRYETLGDECVLRVKQAIQDGVAVALAGCAEEPVTIAVAHAQSLGGAPQASVWGAGFKASVVQAAQINGMATHVLDFEPMWSPPTHSVSPTVPVAFALAEWKGADGRGIISAVAAGSESWPDRTPTTAPMASTMPRTRAANAARARPRTPRMANRKSPMQHSILSAAPRMPARNPACMAA